MGFFDVVKEFDAMRQGIGTGLPAPAVPEPPQISYGGFAPNVAAPAVAPAGKPPSVATLKAAVQTAAVQPNRIPVPAALKLAAWGGQRFDSTVVPQFQALSSAFPGLRVTSGYRDPEHNAQVGGVKNSWHTKGRAGDFVGSAADMQAGAAWARAHGAREVLIHNVGSGQHLHVAF